VKQVEELTLSQKDAPHTHSTQREIPCQVGISVASVNRIIKKDLRLKCFKRHRAHELTENNKLARYERCRCILKRYPALLVNFIWFTDEKLFSVALPNNAQNDRLYAATGTRKREIPVSCLLRTRPTFSRSLMVSVKISALGRTAMHVVDQGTKINGDYYRNQLLKKDLLPEIREFSDYLVFQQDQALAHRACETVAHLSQEMPDFILPIL